MSEPVAVVSFNMPEASFSDGAEISKLLSQRFEVDHTDDNTLEIRCTGGMDE